MGLETIHDLQSKLLKGAHKGDHMKNYIGVIKVDTGV